MEWVHDVHHQYPTMYICSLMNKKFAIQGQRVKVFSVERPEGPLQFQSQMPVAGMASRVLEEC